MSSTRVVVYGGCGALGRSIVETFKTKGAIVTSIDLSANENADENVIITCLNDWGEQQKEIVTKLGDILKEDKVDGIMCVAGGWAGGNAGSKDYIKNCDMMWKQSVWSSTIAGNLAAKFLSENGVLALTGAQPALDGTPGMIGYGMAKAAVMQLCKSLAAEKSGLPKGSCVSCILPMTLDTPMNRKFMSGADFSSWTPLEFVSSMMYDWVSEASDKPLTGSLLKLETVKGETTVTKV